MILVVAEKPSVARDIARVLQCKASHDGYYQGEKYIVSWAIGHLVTLAEPEDYGQEYKKWHRNSLPLLPEKMKLKPVKKTESQLKILKKLMNDTSTDSIICATDSGREGELIFRYIYDIVNCSKPFSRLWISSMTDTAIRDGFANIKPGSHYDLLYLSAKCRSEADWLVGINATRAYTISYHVLLSIGRVQTPTLSMIVDKQKEIDAFVSQEYYIIQVTFAQFAGLWIDEKENSKIETKERADEIVSKIKNQQGAIEKIKTEEKRQLPPLLYDLTELQRDCNKKYGFSAQETLNIAQDLYEKRKMITYPRTDSRYLSDDMIGKINGVLKKLAAIAPYDSYGQWILQLEKLPLSKRIIDNSKVSDHHAIIPADGKINLDRLSEKEKKVFHLIAMRFLAVFYPPYLYHITKVYSKVCEERILSKGTTILQDGWMAIYHALDTLGKKEKTKNKEEEQPLPVLQEGEAVLVKEAKAVKKKTTPPSPYTEASLLSAMENAGRFVEDESLKEQLKESGLGTPATRAAIIERLIAVGYITRKGKSLLPTKKGIQLMEIVPNELKSPQTTGKWEKGLHSIAKGKMTQEKFMGSIQRYVQFLVKASENMNTSIVFDAEEYKPKGKKTNALGTCPSCGNGKILENSKAYFCTSWRQGCKFSTWKNSVSNYGIQLTPAMMKQLLKDKKIDDIEAFFPQTGEKCTYTMILSTDNSGRVELTNMRIQGKEIPTES